MNGDFAWRKYPKYPHQRPEDVAVIERAIELLPDLFDSVTYDVRVGTGRPVTGDVPESVAEDWAHLTKLRVDMVGHRGDEIWVVEVKPDGNPTALGQAVGYCSLFNDTYALEYKAVPAILCANCHPDIQRAADGLGVIVIDLSTVEDGVPAALRFPA